MHPQTYLNTQEHFILSPIINVVVIEVSSLVLQSYHTLWLLPLFT